ncbi:MAG: 4Fe-4S dicluster domain-containing protein [Pseudomonadota bacterium]
MKWTDGAEKALGKVPFFVRKKVRATVESHVQNQGRSVVAEKDLADARKAFVSGMASQVKGFQAESCFGASGCPNRANSCDRLMEKAEVILKEAGILEFLKKTVGEDLKFHHEFRVAAADCPNGCSQPQIKDVGILGAVVPGVGDAECTLCGACEKTCPEGAVTLDAGAGKPVIDAKTCVLCGRCITACPTGCIEEERRGFRVQLGGRLGRHPRLAMELPGVWSEDQVLAILKNTIDFYKSAPGSREGKRFSQVLTREDLNTICRFS